MSITARIVTVGDPATLDTLRVGEGEIGAPGPGELLVRVRATSLNYHDYAVVTGMLGPRPGIVPMSDGAGEVLAVGEGVIGFAAGDRVLGLFFPAWQDDEIDPAKRSVIPGDSTDGFAASHVVRPANWFMPMPEGLSFAEAATLPCAALTAWRALMVEARIKPGDWVLTQGTGGVSLFALQFAKLAGARVIATSSSGAKLERLRALGAEVTINYRDIPKWGREAARITGGVDAVVEIGGAGTLDQSIAACRMGGHISLIGVLAGVAGPVATAHLMGANVTLKGITVGSRRQQADMIAAIVSGGIRPVLDESFPLGRLAEAFRHQESGRHFGKIVVTMDDT
ncbi:NAD(P)-dependent alcohol dehydrogenase [Sphingomonas sp. CGMCC 1.13654]|uniref:NAD(P)-dependent alcohol dehydrogenase n=1 Tax=Sphingomonas chungangi TaxID=2683589 RepID=A0A838L5W7_9SPHN|nr:NAD(P)-dependent alcohol dehydrogenase [Sphingomonas chungangi]MBA2933859.1 NAD(P)-dependent alcohol dehydrogenase [Sphingomonas chungangi]MVW55189.1 zinc-binding dehydrogenase [Sphingomonas chungangi]